MRGLQVLEVEGVEVGFMEWFSWESLWTFGLINCFSQIHRWICVKIRSVLVWKVYKLLPKIQRHRFCCEKVTGVGSRGCWSGFHGMISMGSLWTFGLINFFSQIHCWICVKIRSVLVWKVYKFLPKIQRHRFCCEGVTFVGNRGGWVVVFSSI